MLEDTFNLVDNIVADSASLVGNVTRDARRLAASARGQLPTDKPLVPAAEGGDTARALLASVDAWQDVIVNRPGHCIQCGTDLPRGQHAFRGLSDQPGAPAVWLCGNCLNNL
ncbi:hypothetical protein A167_03050 [Alcanivorax sp. S71-1-4]|nr:hypothetical protein A167_03050 [Alcanivorax sp. S71-1-4]